MNHTILALGLAVLAACVTGCSEPKQASVPAPAPAVAAAKSEALNFKMEDIDGKPVDLEQYAGKTVLIVNVASKCGNTPQYDPLEKLYTKYKDKGFVVLGFPANNFGGQEPGTNAQIKEFCSETYKVNFPMFGKTSVKGSDINPLFSYLTAQDSKPLSKGPVAWNFEKFLINKDGKLVGRFSNRMYPDDPTIVTAIEAQLALN